MTEVSICATINPTAITNVHRTPMAMVHKGGTIAYQVEWSHRPEEESIQDKTNFFSLLIS